MSRRIVRPRALVRRVDDVRHVVRTAVLANGPARWRREVDAVPAAVADTVDPLPDLDLTIPPWPGELTEVGGTEIFVRHTPTTSEHPVPTALYVHGLGGSSTNWTDLAAQLAGYVDGWALDLPGFGRSGPPPSGRYTIAGHVQVVTAYLDRLAARSGGPVHLFGNSMGGLISIGVAARRPDLVRTLTLVSPAVPDLRVLRDDDRRAPLMLIPGVARLVEKRLADVSSRARAKGLLKLVFGDYRSVPAHRIEESAAEFEARRGLAYSGDALLASMKSLVRTWFSAWPWRAMASITAPTLIVWGDRDRLVSPALATAVAATVPRSRLRVIPGSGHVAQMENPVEVAQLWLGTLGPTSRVVMTARDWTPAG